MKNILFRILIFCSLATLSYSCIDEALYTQYASASQIGTSEEALEALSNATSAFMYAYEYFETLASQEFGYPAMMIMRDALTDCPYVSTSYNHFLTPWCSLADFTSDRSEQPWRYYYQMILNANNTLRAIEDPDDALEKFQQFYGNALVYRVLSYLDLMRMYEYKKTGVAALDSEAESRGAYGLTTVIVDEQFDDSDGDHNPRVPFYHMYRFIMNDLNQAERYFTEEYQRPNKTKADLSVVHAYKARLWLEIATRFQKYPEDLATQLAHENDEQLERFDKLGITSAQECYANAADYARRVINAGYAPLTEAQWHSTTNGFNDASVDSWVFAIMITSSDAVHSRVNSFQSNCVTEYSRGYSRSQYHCYRMIDKALYDRISDSDWRKVTWIDPADAGTKPTPAKYHTLLDDDEWALRDAYVGFKYRPNDGDTSDDYVNALQTDFPVIRVEEMYFIEAEALAYTQGVAAGVTALESFMNNHRYTDGSYSISPSDVDDFIDNYLLQEKRIEFWGEGISYFDIKRRELAITRGYTNTNWLESYRYNSNRGYTPSWLNMYVPNEGEAMLNHSIVLNPNPSVPESYTLWRE